MVSPTQEADDGHAYFIGVLEYVRGVLTPLKSAKQPRIRHLEPPRDTREDALGNMCDHLELEEPSETFINAANTPRTEPAPQVE